MNDRQTPLDVGRVFGIIAGRWKIVLAMVLIVMGVAYSYVAFLAHPVYETTALVTYQAPSQQANPTGGAMPSSGVTRENIATLVANATSTAVVDAASTELDIKPSELRRSVQVRPFGDASVVAFAARAGEPKVAAARANAWAKAFTADRRVTANVSLKAAVTAAQVTVKGYPTGTLGPEDTRVQARDAAKVVLAEAQADQRQWSNAISVSNSAEAPEAAVWPKKSLTMIASILIGLGLGSGLALVTARVDHRLHGDEYDELPAPVLVRVPNSSRAPKNTPLGPANAEPIVADSFAGLGSRVMLDRHGDGAHVILVTSARSGEGKSSVAANLASSLALGGRRVVLVDADMRRPTQDQVFPMLQGRPGLSQVLTRNAELEAALTLVAPNLAAISSGPRHANASMLLASVAFRQLLDRLALISEVIVVDAPPVLAVNDALAVAPAAQQVLLVARVGISDLGEINEAHARLASAASTPQAMVLVGTERPQGYGYDKEPIATGRVAMPGPAPQSHPMASMPLAPRAPVASAPASAPPQAPAASAQPAAPAAGLVPAPIVVSAPVPGATVPGHVAAAGPAPAAPSHERAALPTAQPGRGPAPLPGMASGANAIPSAPSFGAPSEGSVAS
ncbi:MAG: polysaccharide biosynthesis tyrosine autokinase [Thermoleophilia bacterium]|nr:polysaccharide biosynthesis tyrosine autokinase [Thermoleophilia bacterium]